MFSFASSPFPQIKGTFVVKSSQCPWEEGKIMPAKVTGQINFHLLGPEIDQVWQKLPILFHITTDLEHAYGQFTQQLHEPHTQI